MKKSYHFDVGDSTKGPIGLCAVVAADSKEQALELLKSELLEHLDHPTHDPNVAYIEVYLNADAITVKDIEEVD